MTDREIMQQAQERLELWLDERGLPEDAEAIAALRERLAQPQRTHWEGCDEVHPECRKPEREKVAAWMIQRGYATGHGDTVEDLLKELEWQVAEQEREACAKVCEDMGRGHGFAFAEFDCAANIRLRGERMTTSKHALIVSALEANDQTGNEFDLNHKPLVAFLEKFDALVRADEREACAELVWPTKQIKTWSEDELTAMTGAFNRAQEKHGWYETIMAVGAAALKDRAAAIRARGQG